MSGCQQTPAVSLPAVNAETLLQDSAFQKLPVAVETEQQIFELSGEVVRQARQQVLSYNYAHERSLALLTFIFGDAAEPLEYVNNATLIASETFQKKEANCLSLTILAYSLSQQLGFEAHFQDVDVPEYWITRSGNSMLNGHVNLMIYPNKNTIASQNFVVFQGSGYLIDFDMVPQNARQQAKRVPKQTIVAMFYNNKAGDAMMLEQYDLAYLYLKSAIAVAPELAQNWNNLAVLYRKKEMFALAERVYLHSLELQPDHPNTMANLALLYSLTGRPEQAAELEAQVQRKRLLNPYYFIMLGNEALERQEANTAISHFRRSLRLQAHVPEAYFGLARSYILQQNLPEASRYLQAAKRHTDSGTDKKRYQFKLDMLNAIARQN
jgi:Flp pilus assembly protein TadD